MAQSLSILALASFALGAVISIAGMRSEKFRSVIVQVIPVLLGVVLKTAAIGVACSTASSHFFNSPAEIVGLLAWAMGCSYLLALIVSAARSLGAIILPVVVLLMLLSLFFSTQSAGPAASSSTFLAPHILSAFLGYGLFLTACGASILYLEQNRLLKRKSFGPLFQDLPSLERLEKLAILCSWLGLLVFSLALATGAQMATETGKPFWLEPKFLSAQITWLIFFVLVLGRSVRVLTGRMAAKFVLVGAGLVLLTFALAHPLSKPQTTLEWLRGTGGRMRA